MKGKYDVIVQNSIVQFKFTVTRNITILRGDSATGKSTLVEMIRQHEIDGERSGVSISCAKSCTVITGIRWQNEISEIKDSVVFLDEGFEFISGKDFAEAVKDSDNYYVIVTREPLYNLPYSIKEIYGLKNVTRKQKYQVYDRIYSEFYPIYNPEIVERKPETIIVEDSNSGYEFFSALCNKEGMKCISAKGKSNVYAAIRDCTAEVVLVVADGAAFGPELERALSLRKVKNVMYFLPESFEWLILKSGLIESSEVQEILQHPQDFIESKRYISWERFFTALLVDKTKDSYLKYSKSKLNKNYLNKKEQSAINSVIEAGTSIKL